jgi:hypothetical protein
MTVNMHGFSVANRCLPGLLRAMSAAEAWSVEHIVIAGEVTQLHTPDGVWKCEPNGEAYTVTLPDGRSADGSTVANALAAARSI